MQVRGVIKTLAGMVGKHDMQIKGLTDTQGEFMTSVTQVSGVVNTLVVGMVGKHNTQIKVLTDTATECARKQQQMDHWMAKSDYKTARLEEHIKILIEECSKPIKLDSIFSADECFFDAEMGVDKEFSKESGNLIEESQ